MRENLMKHLLVYGNFDIYGTTYTHNPPSPTYTLKTDENEIKKWKSKWNNAYNVCVFFICFLFL